MTLARFFIKLCSDRDMSIRQVALRGKLDPSTPFKIIRGAPVQAGTLGACLRGLGLKPSDAEYREAFALWGASVIEQNGADAIARGIARAAPQARKTADRLIAKFATALTAIPRSEWPRLERVLDEPDAITCWLRS